VGHVHVSSERSVTQSRGSLRKNNLGSMWTCYLGGGGGGGGREVAASTACGRIQPRTAKGSQQ